METADQSLVYVSFRQKVWKQPEEVQSTLSTMTTIGSMIMTLETCSESAAFN